MKKISNKPEIFSCVFFVIGLISFVFNFVALSTYCLLIAIFLQG
jgi:hypothetical protein